MLTVDWLLSIWPLGAAATVLLVFIVLCLVACNWLAKWMGDEQ